MKNFFDSSRFYFIFIGLLFVGRLDGAEQIQAIEQTFHLDERDLAREKISLHLDSPSTFRQIVRFSERSLDDDHQLDFIDVNSNILFFRFTDEHVLVCHCDDSSLKIKGENTDIASLKTNCAQIESELALKFLNHQGTSQQSLSQALLITLNSLESRINATDWQKLRSRTKPDIYSPNIEYRNLFYIGQELGHARGEYHQFKYRNLNAVIIVPTDRDDPMQIAWTEKEIRPAVFRSLEFSNLFFRPLLGQELIGFSHFFDSLHIFSGAEYTKKMATFISVLMQNSQSEGFEEEG